MSEDKKEEKKFEVDYTNLKPLDVKKSKGKFKTKIKTLPKEPTLKKVRDFLGYKKGGLIKGKHKLAKRGF